MGCNGDSMQRSPLHLAQNFVSSHPRVQPRRHEPSERCRAIINEPIVPIYPSAHVVEVASTLSKILGGLCYSQVIPKPCVTLVWSMRPGSARGERH